MVTIIEIFSKATNACNAEVESFPVNRRWAEGRNVACNMTVENFLKIEDGPQVNYGTDGLLSCNMNIYTPSVSPCNSDLGPDNSWLGNKLLLNCRKIDSDTYAETYVESPQNVSQINPNCRSSMTHIFNIFIRGSLIILVMLYCYILLTSVVKLV